jgi:hypothetical protein
MILLANVLQSTLQKVLPKTKVKIFRHCRTINFSEDYLRRQSRGFVEGFNNRVKVLKRRCYGIFDVGESNQFMDKYKTSWGK